MYIPTLPTDNLYKFLALSGLAIVLFSIVFPMLRISEINIKLAEVKTRSNILDIEIEELNEAIDRWKDKANPTPEETASLKKRANELRIKRVESEERIEQAGVFIADLKSYWRLLRVGLPLGIVMSLVGFWLWYVRVQKPTDLLLWRQLKSDNE